MRDSYKTVASPLRCETDRVKGSRFIADVAPVATAEAAERVLDRVRAEFRDATHHCWAWRLGPSGESHRSSDDGEPGGSAGRPILRQIEGHDITDVTVVVTRYFGGTKLGVGGLARAYGGATALALGAAEIRRVDVTRSVFIEYPYEVSNEVQRLLASTGLQPTAAKYGPTVRVTLELPLAELARFVERLRNATAGRATAVLDG